jgi:SAM-dependent methyltransferase
LDDYSKLKAGVKWMWSLGDYGEVAIRLEAQAQDLAARCGIRHGMEVLDVAAGNGNFAIAAARAGARVTASDLTPKMVELCLARTAADGLEVEWHEADVEELPFDADRFDAVASVFGAMFAPRPDRVASEMFRVAKRGGVVAMANYGFGGFLAQAVKLIQPYSPRSPLDLPSPFEWGDETELRRRFDGLASSIDVQHRKLAFEFGHVEDARDFWERTNPPVIALRGMLPPDAYQKMRAALTDLIRELGHVEDGRILLESDFLSVVATKRFPPLSLALSPAGRGKRSAGSEQPIAEVAQARDDVRAVVQAFV